MKILAKSTGLTLAEHTANVIAEGKAILSTYPFVVDKYLSMTNGNLPELLHNACEYHDLGKSHPRWQNACQKDYEAFIKWTSQTGKDENDYYKEQNPDGGALKKARLRHEIASLVKKTDLPEAIQVAIASHHQKLSLYHEKKWTDPDWAIKGSQELWDKFRRLGNKFTRRPASQFRTALLAHYEYAGLRGLLQLADVRASITEQGKFIPEFDPFSFQFPEEWTKRPVQLIAESNWQDELLLIRAPTGAGKTSAAMLWAKKQIDNKRADRLVIAMPTRFTSNALASNINKDIAGTGGLYHSSAWYTQFHEKAQASAIAKHQAKQLHELARKLLTPVTVCTIDHLMMALTLSREDHHSIVFNLAHSCVVIDEADFYDEFTQANMLVLLEALRVLQVPVMVMSASLPESSLELYQRAGFNVKEIKEDTSDNDRVRCEIVSIQDYSSLDGISDLLQECLTKPAIIYVNTVDKAIAYYEWFKDNSDIIPIVYHSRFTPSDKQRIEKELLDNLGRAAWENNTAKDVVAILTQIGEMSINISAELMISEACPIDRLVQRAGRLCRFDKKVGKLHVLIPHKTNPKGKSEVYSMPYAEKIEGRWLPSTSFNKSLAIIKCKQYSAGDFVEMINHVYDKIEEFSVLATENAKLLKQQFACNWIVLPTSQSEVEDTQTQFWKSRNIENNATVFVKEPERYYNNYMDWQIFQNENAVEISVYNVRKGIASGELISTNVVIKEDEQKVYFTNKDVYNSRKGLLIKGKDSIFP